MSSRILTATLILFVTFTFGCESMPEPELPVGTGVLSTYQKLERRAENSWRYADKDRLGRYGKFIIANVQVIQRTMKPRMTDDEIARAKAYILESFTKALSDRYAIVTSPASDVAELHIIVTNAFVDKGYVGVAMEGEILDSVSSVQVGAILEVQRGDQYVFRREWMNAQGRKIIDKWAGELRAAVDEAHK